jgi:AcrR family transcriptional regulator
MKPMSAAIPPRRSPVQERSLETVQRVLTATAAMLGRGISIESLTTAQIATEAGLSVGALYRFFPDKQAIVDAIAIRHMELFQEVLAGNVLTAFPEDAAAFLGAVIDAFVAYLEANPDFRILAFGAPGGGRYVSRPTRDAYAGAPVAETVQDFVAVMFGIDPSPELAFRLRVATEIGDRLLAFAFEQSDQASRSRVIAEAKCLLAAYLFAPATPDAPSPA